MKSLLVMVVVAAMMASVLAQLPPGVPDANGNVMLPADPNAPKLRPAIMTPAPDNYTKPIIFDPVRQRRINGTRVAVDPDAPLTGSPPAKLKKAKVTKNVYGGSVEFENVRDKRTGCRCRRQRAQKYRYDAEYKPAKGKKGKRCHCGKKKKKSKHALPPVVAELYPAKKKHNRTKLHNCKKPKKNVTKIAPEYKPARIKRKKFNATNCHKKHKKGKKHVVPEFYPKRFNSTSGKWKGKKGKKSRRERRNRKKGTPGK